MGKKIRKKKPGVVVPWKTRFKLSEVQEASPPVTFPPTAPPPTPEVDEPDEEARDAFLKLFALEAAVHLGLADVDPREKLRELGLDPDKAETARASFMRFVEESGGLKGQYPKRTPKRTLSKAQIEDTAIAIRDFVFEHPGCIDTSGPRAYYHPSFKRFILSLLGPGGLAEGCTTAEAEMVTGLSASTLAAFRRQARAGQLAADDSDDDR